MIKEDATEEELRKFCLNGLEPDACEAQADFDHSKAVQAGVDLSKFNMNFAHYRRQGECACMASWVALYNSKASRV